MSNTAIVIIGVLFGLFCLLVYLFWESKKKRVMEISGKIRDLDNILDSRDIHDVLGRDDILALKSIYNRAKVILALKGEL